MTVDLFFKFLVGDHSLTMVRSLQFLGLFVVNFPKIRSENRHFSREHTL